MQRRVWIKWVECAHRMRQRYKDIKRLQRVLDCQRNFYRMSEYFRIWKALTSPKEVLLPFAHSSRDMKAKTKTLGSWTSTSEIQLDKDNVKLTVYMDRQVQTDYSFTEKVVTTSSPTANSSKEKKSESKEEGEIDDGDEYIIDSREAAVQILAFELRRRGLFIEQ